MKKIMLILGLMMATTICVKGHIYQNNHVSISIQTFYDELAPYGEWIYTPDYGYAWRPYLDYNEGFRPYATRGNWVYTNLGWTWVSDYRWGWATFHYGRWFYDDYFGWMWMPGYEWAPAWVTWGSYNNCYAWAPMGPNIYANFNFSWYAPGFWWTVVPYNRFCSNNWYAYRYNRPVQITNITYITNIYYGTNNSQNNENWYYGPRVNEVERHTNSRVIRRTLVDADKPNSRTTKNDRVAVYRPDVTKQREKPHPTKFRTAEKTQINSRTTENTRINARTTENTRINSRTEPKTKPTTNINTKRHGDPRVAPRTSNQNADRNKKRHNEPRVTTRTSNQTTRERNNYTTTPPKTNVKPPARKPAPTRATPSKARTQVKVKTPPNVQTSSKERTQPTARRR